MKGFQSEMDREDFISNVSVALGRVEPPSDPGALPVRYPDFAGAESAARDALEDAASRASELLDEAVTSLASTGWNVHRAETVEDVGDVVAGICKEIGADNAMRSDHDVLDDANLDVAMARAGIDSQTMVLGDDLSEADREKQRSQYRKDVFKTGVGITGGDYVIAETGTLVIHPQKDVSRLVSLAPPVHIAVMKRGQVLPSLDELFLLEHVALRNGDRHASMNLISGPSRTGDIEATIVHGIHGPVETHIVLVG